MNVDEMLKLLEPPDGWTVDSPGALRNIHSIAKARLENSSPNRRFWYRAVAAGVFLTVLALCPVARSGAQWIWRILHPEQVSVVGVTYELPAKVVAALSAKLVSPPGVPTVVDNRAEAERQAGFAMKLPRSGTLSSQPRFLVVSPGALFEQRLDRAKIQSVLASLHRPDLVMPPAPDGARIRVGFSPGIAALYGLCEGWDCDVTLSEAKSPEIDVSDGVNLVAWIAFSLRLAGATASDADQYAAEMNGVLPLVLLSSPASGVLNKATVNGARAAIFQSTPNGTPKNNVVWISKGQLFSLTVRGSADWALTVANSVE